ncbi:helix-turn-helix domain-containing protein [Streptococcus sp. zg-86]|uniref:Helix-turn-helix domain-containing protein n=1 Tax=Streptococcus zhangguiae TaxID=2664091 RepID=A0A6I4RTU6_9STRE|nr:MULTISPECIES: helix-turn-helix domain-containing protein [unclassified Streptococcus]MTB64435.1 helix-turn-helix domain-containing protein [Streptococcus sp. zg-86]MTB90875.1 helix-turn-helix domain-containing protein [Streptococcus sp. zg-36]MWV56422.1 helix-turn-helix domain-containing protein [Streptococcus sp. zg-70]QTH47371.1 helix-turn-helix domain-containing protein [Streptococcus sp. zg-86]
MYKLIIVEDEHLIRKWLSLAVDYSMLGIEVVGLASHGQEGMSLIRDLQPDIVLTDITMPIMDAFMMFEVTADISYEKIILSGYNDFENAKRAMKFGVCDFISKPIDAEELESCLRTVVERLKVNSVNSLPFKQEYQQFVQEFNTLSSQNTLIQRLLGWVREHYQEHFTIADIAREFGYSESYLYRLIKENLSITLHEYILQYRLKQAVEMMYRFPDMKIYEIADKVGISDYKYFGKLFKNYFGVSPTEFKETEQIKKMS